MAYLYACLMTLWLNMFLDIKVKVSRNRPGVFQRVPGVLGSHIS
jgi:hypothetical protein